VWEYRDSSGMTGTVIATVDWIDTVAPKVDKVVYSPAVSTSEPVLATLTLTESGVITPASLPPSQGVQ
jgi:hypothetical protein